MSKFNWRGTINMDADKVVAVTLKKPILAVIKSGQGTISATRVGPNDVVPALSCFEDTCRGSYTPGTQIKLIATAASGYSFAGWSSSTPYLAFLEPNYDD